MNRAFHAEEQPGPTGQFISLFALVQPEDYTPDMATFPRQEDATVIRTVGRCTVDFLVEIPGINGIEYAAALIVMGDEAVENTFIADAADLQIHNVTPFVDGFWDENVSRFDILQFFFNRIYSGSYVNNAGGTPIDAYNHINVPDNTWFEWDVTQKRKMKTDEGLWLLITGQVATVYDPPEDQVIMDIQSRTLITL